ncbi:MAG: geranylgeranyl reductase family protein [Candidatus Thorarchaeota archaeon]
MSHDAIIVGAGPAGLIAAHRIAGNGHEVLVIEEHKEIGKPDHCAGLLSSTGLRRLGLIPPKHIIQNNVVGARIHSPSGHSLLIERGEREAFVVNRMLFDQWLAERAIKKGAEVKTEEKVTRVSRGASGEYQIRTSKIVKDDYVSRAVISGEGSRCQISGQAGLPQVPRKNKYPAYQYEVSGVDIESNLVEMFYGRRISKGFFAWIIPLGDGKARVGMASRDRPKQRLQAAMKHHSIMKERLRGASIERGFGGIVLVGMPIKKTVEGGFLAVGDAAGIVKATTGGGVVVGGTAAEVAGKLVSSALTEQDGALTLMRYEKSWRSLLLKDLRTMFLAQRAITSLSDRGLDELIKGANDMSLVDIVKREGDMDMQGKVITSLLKNPHIISLGFKVIRYLNPIL